MYKNILVAYDGSPLSDRALEAAKYHGKREEDVKVYLIHVIRSTGPRTNAHMAKSIREELIRENQPKVDQLVESFLQENIETTAKILVADNHENPGKLICKYAEDHDIELIIMGSRGLGNVKKLLLGSVSNYIVQRAKCPIFMIK